MLFSYLFIVSERCEQLIRGQQVSNFQLFGDSNKIQGDGTSEHEMDR